MNIDEGMIDAHTHIGEDNAQKRLGIDYNCDPDLLLSLAKDAGITKIISAPSPGQIFCHNLGNPNHPNARPSLHDVDDYIIFQCVCGETWKTRDPFAEINDYLFKTVERINRLDDISLYPIPIVHPLKPGLEKDIRGFYDEYGIKGVKIHSLVDRTDPRSYIDSELTDVMKDLDLRILWHTSRHPVSLPSNCLEYAEKTRIKSQLAHACRCDEDVLRKVKSLHNVVVDLSPLRLIHNSKKLLSKNEFSDYHEFMGYVIDLAGGDNVLAGSDYYWCGWTPESYRRDWHEFQTFGDERLLYINAQEFWGI